ncbi:MAG: trigger factor [Ignavibacteria bacterium]|nr:trigger factor [Ignavibacteria bacterium]MCU7501278.1 trigger factor [Ignavibacteria bacterium]MCU7511902.1 trigger factor [Ignavibacteria bacterium]MCU7522479.1 trigger factor [Ignavibacteria bacterium]MCU7525402.1 trigger factor [Ignavibacteria bacterium]
METKINVVSESEHELEVVLNYDEIQTDLEKAYQEERKKIEMPGFRKGKAPMALIKKMYGDAIEYQASEKIANRVFWDIVEDQKLNPISAPKMVDLNFEKDSKLAFKIRYEVKPELDVKDYTGLEVKKIRFDVEEEQVNSEVNYLQKTNSTLEDANKVEDKNAIITVDLQKMDQDGKPVEGIKSQDIKIDLTDERVNPQLVENAVGKSVGESFSFSFQDSHEVEEEGVKKIVNDDITYSAEIKSVQKVVLPQLDEEFVKKITKSKFSTPDEWKDNIKKGLQDFYNRQSEDMLVNSLLNDVVKNNDFTPPHGFVHSLLDRMVQMEQERAKQEGVKKFDAHEAHNRLHQRAEWTAKWQIIMENIARKENIKVGEAELRELAEKDAAETGISVDKLLKYYTDSNRGEILLEDKVIDFLKKNNNIKEVGAKDLNNTTEDKK